MSATHLQVIQRFIDFLENKLCNNSWKTQFKKVGPRCFFYKDKVDTIFVKITDENLIIITDGENVIDHLEIIFLEGIDSTENKKEENIFFNSYLQNILHKF
jgi:PP-loop superfamily ATP-utilizing enzyme